MIIESLPVLLTQPQFSSNPKLAGHQGTAGVSLSQAPRITAFVGKTPVHALNFEFLLRSRSEIDDFEDFFNAVCGKWGEFWVPSWAAELAPAANVASSATTLSISPVNYATVYNPAHSETNRLGHYIFMHHIGGTFHVTKVNSVSGSNPEVLTLNTAVPIAMNLGQFYVGFLYHVRFANDVLSLEYNGIDEALVSVGMMETVKATSPADA